MQTVWTLIRPDKTSGLIWIQTALIFEKVDLSPEKNQRRRNYSVGKEFKVEMNMKVNAKGKNSIN